MPGALATTDAEGSDGSEAGVAKALAGAMLERGGAPSCGCLEQASSVNNNANDKSNGANFMGGLSKSSTLLHAPHCKRSAVKSAIAQRIMYGSRASSAAIRTRAVLATEFAPLNHMLMNGFFFNQGLRM